MSRRTITLLSIFFAGLVIANVVVLAIWLPNRKVNDGASAPAAGLTASTTAANSPATIAAAAASPQVQQQQQQTAGGFVVERQVSSPTGNLQIKYLRDRNTKLRRITVDDARQPKGGTLLYETKHPAWALISPDDQWIVVAERSPNGQGNVQLYRRNNASSAQFAPVQTNPGTGLEDTVWRAYLTATEADPNTPRNGATINAMAWENDSRRIDLSVAYLAGANNPDVPAPWSCTYDVTSQQVTPTSVASGDQAEQGTAPAEAPNADNTGANNAFADNSDDSGEADQADNEFPGEKFPATRLDELTVPDVNESSLDDITYAINEMYARHGVDFKDKKVAGQFGDFSWYQRRPGFGANDAEAEFSDLEKANLKTLRNCRDAKIASAKRKSRPARAQRGEEESPGEKVLRGIRMWQDMGGPMPPHP